MAKVTLKDIAIKARVSTSTVSLVLRNSPLVAPRTRDGVRAAMNELAYVYNRRAANLRTRRSGTIGILVPEITNPFYAEFVAGIDGVLDETGWVAFLANSAESIARQERFIRRVREQDVDGVILVAAEGTSAEVVDTLRRSEIPCVQTLRRLGGGDYIGPDYRTGLAEAVAHLVGRGHRRIAYVGGVRATSASAERLDGYLAAMRRANLAPGPHIACLATRPDGTKAVSRLLALRDPPTAAICYNDILALGVIAGLVAGGRTPGRDFAVIGFDDIAEAALSRPALTTLSASARNLGTRVAQRLLNRISAPDVDAEQILLPPRLICRDT